MIWLKALALIFGISTLLFFWIVINAMTRPVYNKMHNIYQEDEKGRVIANYTIGAMIIVSFLLGYMLG
jgi:HAMP domain-containing protein